MKLKNLWLLLTLTLTLIASTSSFAEDEVLQRDFATFLEWFPGVYDNQEQVAFQDSLGVPEDERHERIHHVFEPVELPAFGEHVFYVQQHIDDDPGKIYRQRIYVFTVDHEEAAIRLAIHTPNDVESLIGAHLDPSKLDGLTPDDATNRPGCDVFWTRNANQFTGYMKDGACSFVSQRSGKKIIINDDLLLSEEEIWISDRAEDEDGNYVFGNKAGVPHKNRKARDFKCWMAVLKHDEENWSFDNDLEVWDQGGTAWVTTEEDEPQTVGIKIRNVVWPTGTNKNSLVLYVYKGGDERAVSYVWGEPEANRLALNLRWMQASCTHTVETGPL